MDVERSALSVDHLIFDLARRQHGCIARWQLLPLGVSREMIAVRLRREQLVELHRGVYLVGAVRSEHTLAQAALLAVRGIGTLSCFTAAHLWNARQYPSSADPWLTIPADRKVHRSKMHVVRGDLERRDKRVRARMPITSPPRTVLDCAALLDDEYELEALVAEMQFRGLAKEHELYSQMERSPGRTGVPKLRSVLGIDGGPQRTRSKGERVFLRLLRETGFTDFKANSRVFGPELDFVWEAQRFAVELDGWDGHSSRSAFERDRLKVANLAALGVHVMPITGRQIKSDRDGVVRRLAEALSLC